MPSRHRHDPTRVPGFKPLDPAKLEQILYGVSIPDKFQKDRLTQTQQENPMPDLKTALTTALEDGKRRFLTTTINTWDKEEQELRQPEPETQPEPQPTQEKFMFETTGNLSRDVFDYVKKYSGQLDQRKVVAFMTDKGYLRSSASSIVTQMVRVKMLKVDENGMLSNLRQSYTPLGTKYRVLAQKRKPKETPAPVYVPKAQGIAALKKEPAPIVKSQWDADTVINNIGIKEAHKLYEELKKYFG